jgi:hypothetical protein
MLAQHSLQRLPHHGVLCGTKKRNEVRTWHKTVDIAGKAVPALKA